MSELFISILNMSLISSYVIIFVMLIRIPLKKAPKVISYALWSVVAFRLIVPFSFESRVSLMPTNISTNPIPRDIIYQQSPQINSGIKTVDSLINQSLPVPSPGASANPLQIYAEIGAYVWILGMAILLVYSLASILILKKELKKAELLEDNIYQAENLKTPFVLGLIRPKIYLPAELKSAERSYILLHEQTHIARKDHLIKILAFFIVSIHWFNPLVWLAFILMSRDMELSCDEKVLKEMDDIKKPYASSLLSLAAGSPILNGSPLAFGEGNVKGRIKNVMNYKKPKFWVIVVSVFVLIGLAIALISNPSDLERLPTSENLEYSVNFEGIPAYPNLNSTVHDEYLESYEAFEFEDTFEEVKEFYMQNIDQKKWEIEENSLYPKLDGSVKTEGFMLKGEDQEVSLIIVLQPTENMGNYLRIDLNGKPFKEGIFTIEGKSENWQVALEYVLRKGNVPINGEVTYLGENSPLEIEYTFVMYEIKDKNMDTQSIRTTSAGSQLKNNKFSISSQMEREYSLDVLEEAINHGYIEINWQEAGTSKTEIINFKIVK